MKKLISTGYKKLSKKAEEGWFESREDILRRLNNPDGEPTNKPSPEQMEDMESLLGDEENAISPEEQKLLDDSRERSIQSMGNKIEHMHRLAKGEVEIMPNGEVNRRDQLFISWAFGLLLREYREKYE